MSRLVRIGSLSAVLLGGAALLSVEFAGQRLLAVHWGDSLAVWGSAISVVLGGMALGYALGGRLADRRPGPGALVFTLGSAASVLMCLSLWGAELAASLADMAGDERWGSLLGATALLGPVSVLLAMTTPLVTRMRLGSLDGAGARVGDIYALGTVGSIAGALGTTFFALERFELSELLALAGALVLVPYALLLAALPHGREAALLTGLALAAVAASIVALDASAGDAAAGRAVRFQEDSPYHRVLVTDTDDGVRLLQFNATLQSAQRLDDPDALVFAYTQAMHRAWCAAGPVKRVALIGVGAGTLVRSTLTLAPDARMDAVDIDPVVLRVARRFFDAPSGPGVRYALDDGRRFLRDSAGGYDLVLLDAFSGLRVPPHLLTREFFELARERMAPGGALAVNLIAAPDSRLAGALVATARQVWPEVRLYDGQFGQVQSGQDANVVMVASDVTRPQTGACLAGLERRLGLPAGVFASEFAPLPAPDGPVLTDDYAPADQLR